MSVSHSITLRPIRPEDAWDVASLVVTAFTALDQPVEPPPSALRVDSAQVSQLLKHPGSGGVIATLEETLVGCVLWEERDQGLYVSRLAVSPSYRRGGIARSLLTAAEKHARRRGMAKLTLATRQALTNNLALFATTGFVETATRAHPDDPAAQVIDLEKALDPAA